MLVALALLLQAATHPLTGVAIQPGDAMIIRPENDGTVTIIVPKADKTRKPGPGEVRVSLELMDKQTILTVENNDPKLLDYQAIIVAPDGATQRTSVCRVMADGKPSFEAWPYKINELGVLNFRRTTETEIVCR
ncbi:MAG: hypothetical protein ABI471_04855 [Sphingomonas bacterium]